MRSPEASSRAASTPTAPNGGLDVTGKAVLVDTGWASIPNGRCGGYLRDGGATLVGIDSFNIDDTGDGTFIPYCCGKYSIVEHLRDLEQLPATSARFTAVPPKSKEWERSRYVHMQRYREFPQK